MLIDSTRLMYRSMQTCRHAPYFADMATALNILDETLDFVKQQKMLIVDVPHHWVWKKESKLQGGEVVPWAKFRRNNAITSANQKLFALIDVGAGDLRRLWAADSVHAVRRLGYAFHIIPRLLWKPATFDPEGYLFLFRLAGKHWGEFSVEMQQAFCDVVGLTLEEAAKLVSSE